MNFSFTHFEIEKEKAAAFQLSTAFLSWKAQKNKFKKKEINNMRLLMTITGR